MVAADGSVVTIVPVAAPQSRPSPPRRDPFAELELMKGRVAALLAADRSAPKMQPEPNRSQKLAMALKTAASFLIPASLARRFPGMALEPGKIEAPRRPIEHRAEACAIETPPAADRVDVASLQLAPLVATGTDADRGKLGRMTRKAQARATNARMPAASLETAGAPLADVGDTGGDTGAEREQASAKPAPATGTFLARTRDTAAVASPGAPFDAAEARSPMTQIEIMLAQQIAAAHGAAMTLINAAVQSMHDAAEEAGGAGVRRSRKGSATAAQLANSAARLMQAYTDGLATLAMLRGGEGVGAAPRRLVASDAVTALVPLNARSGKRRVAAKGAAEALKRPGTAGARRRRSPVHRATAH
jgi:hypothetical protein